MKPLCSSGEYKDKSFDDNEQSVIRATHGSGAKAPSALQVFVKTLTAKTIVMKVNMKDTIDKVKATIEETEGVDPD